MHINASFHVIRTILEKNNFILRNGQDFTKQNSASDKK